MKKIIILFLLFISSFYAIGITSYETDRDVYAPGDSGFVTLNISLTHTTRSGETLLRFSAVTLDIGGNFALKNSMYLGDIEQGSLRVSIPIKIGENVSSGLYTMDVRATASAEIDTGGGVRIDSDASRSTIPIKVVEDPVLSLTVQPDIIRERGNVNLTLCNKGGAVRDVEMRVLGSFSFVQGSAYFGDISKDDCKTVKADIDATGQGKVVMNSTFSYKDAIGDRHNTTLSIPVVVDRLSQTISIVHENEVLTNKESVLKLRIDNRGKDASEVRIRTGNNLSLVGRSEILIPFIGSGKSMDIEFDVYTQLSPGIHEIPLSVVWKEEGEEKTSIINAPIKVSSEDGVGVFLDADPLPLIAGEERTLSIIVANKAGFEISSLSVSIVSNSFEVLDVENKKFIGSLQKDDFSTEQFKIRLKNEAAGTSNISVELEYKDPSGNIVREIKESEILVRSSNKGLDFGPILLLGVIIIVGYYGWKKYKTWKK